MDFIRQTIKRNHQRGKGYGELTIEDDYIVPDVKPDVAKIIHIRGKVQIEETKITNQSLWVSGKMVFVVLYRSEDENKKIEAAVGAIPFQEKILMDDLEDNDEIIIRGRVDDIAATMINSRKLGIRGVVHLDAMAEVPELMEMTLGMENEEQYETRFTEETLLELIENQKDILRIRKETDIPASKPNMDEVIFTSGEVRNLEQNPTSDGIMIQGEAYVCIIYRSGEEENVLCYETMIPFNGNVESKALDNQDIFWLNLVLASVEVEAREDYDGEPRTIGVELIFDTHLKVWKEQKVQILEDFYSLEKQVIPEKEKVWMEDLLVKNHAKIRLGDTFKLDSSQEKMMQICCSRGDVTIEEAKRVPKGIQVEGFLKVHILYMTSDEYMPMGHHEAFLPIEQLIEVPDSKDMGWFDLQSGLLQLQVNLLDGMEYEVKATVSIMAIAFEELEREKIVRMEELPQNPEEKENQPGFVGYILQEDENLWDIARKYQTTVSKIMETNHLREEELPAGSKLILIKEVEPA